MPAAEAHVPTQNASRYLTQLCKHAQQAHRLPHRAPGHDGDDGQPPPRVQDAEWAPAKGVISFGWGQCILQATPGMLILRAEATSEENLQRLTNILAADIERFGAREHLTVTWQHPSHQAAQPRPAS